ncbi:hypothetical protein ACIQFU_14425 [Streptomyces sp. NPDC093065]|uniref:hypothetical protein n=1 Tax=Streptomyces sp. NPDC093065 TaxID=3366021 RepID=UPI00382C237A
MHRTTTTATLVLTVAVSAAAALTGCTTVRGPAEAHPPAAGARSSAPRPDGPAAPRVVQAPAREALEMISPSPSPSPERTTAAPRRTEPQAPPAAPRDRPADPAPEPRSARPAAPDHTRAPASPRPGVPDTSRSGTGGTADVCTLGKQYGGWRPGSPEARICEQAYGR